MNCSRIRDLLPDYAVELLDGRTRVVVERHLEECADCRAELRVQDDVMTLVEQYGVRQPPVGLFNGVRNRIEADGPRERPAWWSWLYSRPARALAMGTALASLALALFLPANPGSAPALTIHPTSADGAAITSTALADSIRQHAISAGDGPVTDRVAWYAMAELALQDNKKNRPGVE